MKKIIIIVLGLILIVAILIILIINLIKITPMYKEHQNFVNNFDLELKGEIIEIKSDTSLRIACIKVEESNYKEYYKVEGNRFFIRVKDSLAIMIYSSKHLKKPRIHHYEVGSQLLINHNNNKKIIEIEGKDTIDRYGIETFPIRNYLKNSCIPD